MLSLWGETRSFGLSIQRCSGHLAKVCGGEKSSKKKTGKGTDSGKQEGKQTGSRDSKPAKGKKQPTHLVD